MRPIDYLNKMQNGGEVEGNSSNYLNYILETSSPDTMKSIMESEFRTAPKELFDKASAKTDSLMNVKKERQRMLMEQYPELFQENQEPIKKSFFKKLFKKQEGGMIFETAISDNTAHSQMDRLIAENEINQMPRTPFSFLNRDRIDKESQELMDIAMSVSMPMMGATKLKQFSPNIRNMLGKMRKDNRFSDKTIHKSLDYQKYNPKASKEVEDYYSQSSYFNNLLSKAMKEYNRKGSVNPNLEIFIKNISKKLRPDHLYQDRKNFPR
tara:strand:+ start:7867 stop:8667 length:801 start_codon:yes stop_codon:yes gene_type:complete